MHRRTRRARVALCAVLCGVAGVPATADAQVTTDLTNWNLTETLSIYGGGTQFHISSSSGGLVRYRWLDSPNKVTVISGNSCSDLANYGNDSFAIGDTNYHSLFTGATGLCFVMRGRTSVGSGSMVNHDGRVSR
ncbi:MAG TPA: hypothetical protein VNS09_12415 [Solirubrobacter sp.]|nr:hypothetical protein [Solirubrobacter sp.]